MSNLTKLTNKFSNHDWQSDVSLAKYTFMRVGGPAEVFWIANSLDELVKVVSFCFEQQIPVTIFGGASNVIVMDEGIAGLVVLNQCSNFQIFESEKELSQFDLPDNFSILTSTEVTIARLKKIEDDNHQFNWQQPHWVLAESGLITARLSTATANQGLSGLEPFVGVPGALGGAIYNNSHYQSELIGDFIVAVEVLDKQGNRNWLPQKECDFAYDYSRFQQTGEIILRALLVIFPADKDLIKQKIQASSLHRAQTQPLGFASSGCIFKNVSLSPEESKRFDGQTKLSAGWLIDQAGLKGYRQGGAMVSDVHANFIINTDRASSHDVEKLVSHIQKTVKQKFNLDLEPEVFFIGKEK